MERYIWNQLYLERSSVTSGLKLDEASVNRMVWFEGLQV